MTKILHHLKSPPCDEMMAFYIQFFKFDFKCYSLIKWIPLKISIKLQHILYQTWRYLIKIALVTPKIDYLMCKPPKRRNKTKGSIFTKQEEQNKGVRLLKPRGTKWIDHFSQSKRNKMKKRVAFHKQGK